MSDHTERLRRALEAPAGPTPLEQLARSSLISFAQDDPDLKRVADEMTAPLRAELDLHLEGTGVHDHETDALPFGRFVARTATAVKEIAKSARGLGRLAPRLQVVGPAAGSVRVVFRAPEDQSREVDALAGTQVESVESLAMRRLAALVLQAEDQDPDSPLDASVQRLRGEARRAIRLMGQQIVEAHWRIAGELRQRGHESIQLTLSEAGAQRLVTAATRTDAEVASDRIEGTVDGWIWSEAIMLFQPTSGRRIKVSVDQDPLQSRVADLVHEPDRTVIAEVTVVTTYPRGDTGAASRSFSLEGISVLEQPELPHDAS